MTDPIRLDPEFLARWKAAAEGVTKAFAEFEAIFTDALARALVSVHDEVYAEIRRADGTLTGVVDMPGAHTLPQCFVGETDGH